MIGTYIGYNWENWKPLAWRIELVGITSLAQDATLPF
jgi:hypothetical protein